ncbi:hypothetical protein BST61_g2192 [Cercospora zeina]
MTGSSSKQSGAIQSAEYEGLPTNPRSTSTAVTFVTRYEADYGVLAEPALVHGDGKLKGMRQATSIEKSASQFEDIEGLFHGCEAPQDDFSELSGKRTLGSCLWVLEDPILSLFLNGTAPEPQLLWCYCGPGMGKSVTATLIIESLMEESKACAYYYFRSNHRERNEMDHFLTSVASQLARCIPEYRRKLAELAGDSPENGKAGYELLWKNVFTSSLLRCNIEEPIYVIVDGLDEFHQTKGFLQQLLPDMENAEVPVRWLLISRPTLEMETSINRLSERMDVQRLPLENNVEDIELYVRDALSLMPGNDIFKEKTVNEILVKADGIFLGAKIAVQDIGQCKTESEVEQALQGVPGAAL